MRETDEEMDRRRTNRRTENRYQSDSRCWKHADKSRCWRRKSFYARLWWRL